MLTKDEFRAAVEVAVPPTDERSRAIGGLFLSLFNRIEARCDALSQGVHVIAKTFDAAGGPAAHATTAEVPPGTGTPPDEGEEGADPMAGLNLPPEIREAMEREAVGEPAKAEPAPTPKQDDGKTKSKAGGK